MSEEVRQVVIGLPPTPWFGIPLKRDEVILLDFDLAPGATTPLADCAHLDLTGAPRTLMLQFWIFYAAAAVAGARIHVRASPDNDDIAYDTIDWDTWDVPLMPADWAQISHSYETCPMYLKVLVENLDAVEVIPWVSCIAIIGA